MLVSSLNDSFDGLLNIDAILKYVLVARNLVFPVNYALLSLNNIENLLLEYLYKFGVDSYIFNDKDHVVVDKILHLRG